jgi:hypothetical protein
MPVILQVNFNWDVEEDVARGATAEDAQPIADRDGVQWKVWIRDAETRTSGGIYLFSDRESAGAWREELRADLTKRPGVSDFDAQIFDVLEVPTRVTRGPIGVGVEA